MLKAELEKRREACKAQFDALADEKAKINAREQEIDQELLRLQGEYRLLGDLINEPSDKESKPDGTKPRRATVPAG